MDDDSKQKKAKGTKKAIIKCNFRFENYADCLFNNKIISQLRFKVFILKCIQKKSIKLR